MTRWAVLQHVAFEAAGLLGAEAAARGVVLDAWLRGRGAPLPAAEEIDGLVVLGGPMGAEDVRDEWPLVAAAVRRGLPVLGVCLGAQVMAAALGGRAYRGPSLEIGHGAVRVVADDPVLGPAGGELPVFHWHHDTFDLPPDATRLAASDAYANQAFRLGARAYGLQFHVELDAALADAWRPHLPDGVAIEAPVDGAGRQVIARFFGRALGW